ncbi:MAG: family 20 glycosylhydrolase [Clostridia bacterium]|nr:family 20 glycosylhydrolase [Clostridia bacterium]
MFFKPQIWNKNSSCALAKDCRIEGAEGYVKTVLEKLISAYGKSGGEIKKITVCNNLPVDFALSDREEGYALTVEAPAAILYGETLRARIYAAVTLQQMTEHHELCNGTLQDAPDCPFRGHRAFLPGSLSMEDYKKTIDFLVYYKYNCISFEIGGAMEYKSHPEINETWKAFSAECRRYSGRAQELNDQFSWRKTSIHPSNGDGEIVSQARVKEMIAYANERGIEVYPEVPTLSHSEYFCMAHPELAERKEDPRPDAYCPNNPETYRILFEIMQEILDVFNPRVVNIGHDELYTVGICERCKNTPPHELFVQDIVTIYNWLKERGVRTMMWGDKLLPIVLSDGRHYGGAGGEFIRMRGGKPRRYDDLPTLYYCQSMLPKDIIMLHWYGAFGIQYDYVYHTHGYTDTYFGNMALGSLKDWRRRRNLGIKGGAPSNWGPSSELYMQRNCIYYNLVLAAFALWSKEYDDPMLDEVSKAAFEDCFFYKFGDLSNTPHITVCHTTDHRIRYAPFYDGRYFGDNYHLGHYLLTYTDGTTATFDVNYGENITNCNYLYYFDILDKNDFDEDNLSMVSIAEVSCSTVPERVKDKTYYKTVFINPHPEKEIASFEYVSESDATIDILTIEY